MRPLWIVCEDGSEYLERFRRFLDGEFDFAAAGDGEAALAALSSSSPRATGVILDLDFRRTRLERLVDEQGERRATLPEAERRRLAESQGILILRLLRQRGCVAPALLCADLDDASQVEYLERALAPLSIVPSHEGLREIAARMRTLSNL